MDWGTVSAVAVVVVPTVGAATAWLNTQIDNKIMKNNDVVMGRINGTYVRTTLQDEREERTDERFQELQREISRLHPHRSGR